MTIVCPKSVSRCSDQDWRSISSNTVIHTLGRARFVRTYVSASIRIFASPSTAYMSVVLNVIIRTLASPRQAPQPQDVLTKWKTEV